MSHKGQTTTLEERVTIAERVDVGQSSREIAAEQGASAAYHPQVAAKVFAGRASRSDQPDG